MRVRNKISCKCCHRKWNGSATQGRGDLKPMYYGDASDGIVRQVITFDSLTVPMWIHQSDLIALK